VRIIHLASELSPYAKVGGLGDVLQGLCHELAYLGHTVEVILPKYEFLKNQSFEHLPYAVTLIESPGFDRPNIYGYEDDAARFGKFSKKAADYVQTLQPDVVHLHDWHTALVAKLLPNTLLTIHNLAYAGTFKPELFQELNLYLNPEYAGDEGYSFMRIGLKEAKKITTVSPSYAKQILTYSYSYSFFHLLQQQKDKLTGILNGLDTRYWNPNTDTYLPYGYDRHTRNLKKELKQKIMQSLGLKPNDQPLACAISRLVWQKGPELIAGSISQVLENGGSYILLGSVAEQTTQRLFENLWKQYGHTGRFKMELRFDEALSHLAFAASDMIIVPSRFEPCGLTQLIGMRYGSVPIVHRTGGLEDTVIDGKTGLCFTDYNQEALNLKIDEAFYLYRSEPSKWHTLQTNGMLADHSWNKSALEYVYLYEQIRVECKKGSLKK
jgi:starch synthase